ncbi:MAG TPA: H-X9-DG-CTERM domain-containing protein [Verrucomicrobiae bacterium]|nr:H-X9-DG-CTERM domain-containing protein [Verrucomicrobiae bacterium]
MKRTKAGKDEVAAFTFAELLVATAALSVIAALALPSLSDANAKARAAYCMSNLKQWGVGYELYAADWNGYLPAEGTAQSLSCRRCWYNAVPPYLKILAYKDLPGVGGTIRQFGQLRIWVCPEKNLRNVRGVSGKNSVSYGMNDYLDGNNLDDVSHHTLQHANLSSIAEPGVTVLLCDIKTSQFYCDPMDTTFQSYPWQDKGQGLHQNGANFLFVDGHVSWFPVNAYWDGSNGITNNPALRWYP